MVKMQRILGLIPTSQMSVTLDWGDLMSSVGIRHVHDARTCIEAKHPHMFRYMCVCLLEFMWVSYVQVFMESRVCQNPPELELQTVVGAGN